MRPETAILTIAWFLAAGGCGATPSRFIISSVRPSGDIETFATDFEPGAFAQDAQRNWEIVFTMRPVPLAVSTPGGAEAGDSSTSLARPTLFSQTLRLRVFRRPRPGRTYVERTQTDANITYCLQSGSSVITYQGGGFVYFTLSSGGRRMEGSLESSSLTPALHVGDAEDLLGPCRIEGTFTAELDKTRVVDVLKRLRRLGAAPAADHAGK